MEDRKLEITEVGQDTATGSHQLPFPSVASSQGVFRRHYPLATLRFCGMDPEQRVSSSLGQTEKAGQPGSIALWALGLESQTEPLKLKG